MVTRASRQLADLVNNSRYRKERHQPPKLLKPSKFPVLPWEKVATDLFHWENASYLLIVDYHSRYIETAKLSNDSSAEVICHTYQVNFCQTWHSSGGNIQ